MELYLGRNKIDQAMHAYFKTWKFKHPYPEDLKATFEKELGQDLSKYFELLNKKGSL